MASNSSIEWTESTWNPTVGCTKISPGCKHCYAEVMHQRLTHTRQPKYSDPFRTVRPWEPHLELPLRWREHRLVFVNSMSDLFHDDIPASYIRRVFDVMARAQQHTFQVLTKRSSRLMAMAEVLPWPRNVWMGVSIESEDYVFRAIDLGRVPAAVRFLSIEPLLGPINHIPLSCIDWVIVGGESGHHARPMDLAWARSIRDQCASKGVPFFLKQLGGARDKRGGVKARLDGKTHRAFPRPDAGIGHIHEMPTTLQQA